MANPQYQPDHRRKRRKLEEPLKERCNDPATIKKLPKKSHKNELAAKRRSGASSMTFQWNSLFLNQDAVLNSVAARFGVNKSAIYDPTSSEAAVKQAHAETFVVQEAKAFFLKQGVDLEAFKSPERSETTLLIKNLPFPTKAEQLKPLLERHGKLSRFLLPPSGTIAIADYLQAEHAQAAFSTLAYRRFGDSVMFLEKAPEGLFDTRETSTRHDAMAQPVAVKAQRHPAATELFDPNEPTENQSTSSVYVKNLNFTTTSERLIDHFKPLDGYVSASVKTKPNPKKGGEHLSMGYGFVEFRSSKDAQTAIVSLDGSSLDEHTLQLKMSQKGAHSESKAGNRKMGQKSQAKIVIKNLPFEASRQDLRSLLGAYGKLKSVRLPKKFNSGSRGFGFAEFASGREAENAIQTLENTHLLGRRLIFEYAKADVQDGEEAIQEMIEKTGKQVTKIKAASLSGHERKKFRPEQAEEV